MANNRNRVQDANTYGTGNREAQFTERNSAFEFATELGANTPAAGTGATRGNQIGRNNARTTANQRGKYGGR